MTMAMTLATSASIKVKPASSGARPFRGMPLYRPALAAS
jgi:hypothetical protein